MRPAILTQPVRIETERLVLRPLTLQDSEAVCRIFSNPEVTRFLEITPLEVAAEGQALIEYFNAMYDRGSGVRWGIESRQDGTLIGTCGFHSAELRHLMAEIGYDLAREHWGKGLVPEAARAVLRHGFERMGLNRVQAHVLPEATPSARVLQKLGFQHEGVLRESGYWKGRFHDRVAYSLLRREWQAREGR